MTFKANVEVLNLKAECLLGIVLTEKVFIDLGFPFTITSVFRSGQKELRHGQGYAFDIRVIDVLIPQTQWVMITEAIREVLRPLGFDVVLENPTNDPKDKITSHIHVEYDPKDKLGNKLIPLGVT